MGDQTKTTGNGTGRETPMVAMRRLLCFSSTLAALALSLAAADAMTGSLLDSLAVVTGILAVRNPNPAMPGKTGRASRVRLDVTDVCRGPFIGVHNLN